ncbi:MAG: hypothetical protein H2B05_07260 [Nitrosopumilaceae archaeon]|uniref:Uncharacterized protein n=1 Tax=Candidatus Nitrosomaritimum aestuariumsis TaxID=3342354 RepID=A0AC60W579_9ARCH|nr:hypothetical protein [Nitrosopumilaceae archaeon]
MYESLKLSIQSLQKSKYGKGNKKKLSAIMHALNRANSIFNSDKQNQTNPESIKQISFRNVSSEEQVPRILDEFMDDFEKECLEKDNGNAKNYSLFSVTSYKIIRTLDSGKRRGLLSAHALNRLNKMFVKHPVKYSKQAIRDPLGLAFVITELAIDIEKNLSIPYEFDQTILDQMVPLLQRYYVQYDDTVRTILEEFSSMPKFKLVIEIGEKHKELIEKFLDYSIARLPLETRIKKAKSILEKIIAEEVDSVALGYYENLKLTFSDETLRPHLSKIAKEMPKTNRRFANTILEEVSAL